MLAGFIHVDVRVGLEADDHVGIAHDLLGDVAVQVQRHANRHARCGGTHAFQQIAFAVVAVFGHHRAMQVEQNGVAAGHGLDDTAREFVIRRRVHRAARVRHGGHRRHQRGTLGLGQFDERGHGGAHALVGAVRVGAVGGRERLDGRGHR
ncbi:hypothetical protein SDC9_68917 [bioreactor metagenome]|uniref:Uncharacterized protein n=1 Tax=bioreactor metagenome TaxID=1076179 RepID=A0A644Y1R3_9ZZZZ